MNTGEGIKVTTKNRTGIITLTRPGIMNVLDTGMLRLLSNSLKGLEDDGEVRVVIITGERHFSAGADIRELREKNQEEAELFSTLGHGVCRSIEKMEKPVIAAISGYALGGGCEMALACDIRIAAESAKIGLPEVNIGLIPGFGGTQRFARLAGAAKAKEMIMTGRIINAKEAESLGLLNKVTADDELMARAEEMAALMVEKSPISLRAIKRLLDMTTEGEKGFELETTLFSGCFTYEDHKEGISAFLEKRKPDFKGV